jgi:tetratricopeptide (TPR) repeat protein
MLMWLLACAPPKPDRPSILFITIDTTRADRLGPYGHAPADTPTWDRLAEQGVVYDRAYASCPLTIPSHSTMFTGRFPPSHGVRDNGDFILGDDQTTFIERLDEAGWTTAAFTSAFPTQARWGFDQGFDLYLDPLERLPTQLDWSDQRTAGEVVDGALGALPELARDGDPLFVWLHLFDAHWPYDPPEPYASEHVGRPYDGEIAYADAQAGRLVAWFEENRPGAVIAVTSDHGEGFGDGGERTHGFLLHDGTLHVPLIVRGPGFEPGTRSADVVSHVDLAPTLLDIAGLAPHEGLQGHDLRQGGVDQVYSEALTGQFNLGLAGLHSFTDQGGRYTEGSFGAWYPYQDGKVTVHPEIVRDTTPEEQQLALLMAQLDEVVAPNAALDEDSFAALMALGYLGGDVHAESGTIDPREVIDLVPLTWEARQMMGMGRFADAEAALARLEAGMPDTFGVELLRAQLLKAQGNLAEAAERYADLYLRAPSSTVALQLGAIHANRAEWPEAEGWFQEALDLQPNSPEAMAGLVHAAQSQGETERARELASQFLEVYPDHADLMLVMAELYLLDQRYEEALFESELALKTMPYSPWAWSTVAQARWELGEADRAIEALQEALSLNRFNLPIRIRLTECLLEVGRNAEAVRTIRPVAGLLPDAVEVQALNTRAHAALEEERAR